jgi:type II restriction enzyme
MPSLFTSHAIEEATRAGNAILKFISANDIGLTGSHQCGFYMPKSAWTLYTPHPPEKGSNEKHNIAIDWPDGTSTDSVVTWYGRGTRSEYRLTRFGRDCPWLAPDAVGNLLMLVPQSCGRFAAWVFDRDEDIEDIESALGLNLLGRWGIYRDGIPQMEDEDDCIIGRFRRYADNVEAFPSCEELSQHARDVLRLCLKQFDRLGADDMLLRCAEAEYALFRAVERHLCASDIDGPFRDTDEFLRAAARMANRRKSRAGRSLENHVEFLLTRAGIPHTMRPAIDGEPDVIIPSARAYYDPAYPQDRLFVLGIKTTCKDRWRQVLNEGRRKREKYIVTLQAGISTAQLDEMQQAGIGLIVPRNLHESYPEDRRARLLTVSAFIDKVRAAL